MINALEANINVTAELLKTSTVPLPAGVVLVEPPVDRLETPVVLIEPPVDRCE